MVDVGAEVEFLLEKNVAPVKVVAPQMVVLYGKMSANHNAET
ncbi:protein of unknown function [Nitrospira japonica]|uniref:Uncharacterized protein n=1 Tax=Nitrospira japonica TaxID=1325564 RepID=A0A1W1I5H4_9BACT|nr:protein of unknown function [Nitrospira japonica]